MNSWSKIIQQWLFPPTCLLCGAPGTAGRDLCLACAGDLPYLGANCVRCALPLAVPGTTVCGNCLRRPPSFHQTHAVLHYREPVRHMVQALKFHRRYPYARLLGALLAESLAGRTELPERLIPVPLHRGRFRQRGFNPSTEIAREAGRQLRIPLDHGTATRRRPTASQVGLTAEARARNVRHAFAIAASFRAQHVAIIDDVMTTGSTVNELAAALRKAGAERIEVWVCARASLDRSEDGPRSL